jgi:ribose 5-phosphate isomerase RpiB
MNVSAAEIERLVREALSRLSAAAPAEPVSSIAPGAKPAAATIADALEVAAQVVTLAEVDGRLGDKRRLIVAPKAVVTPAVRDVLRQRNIVLERRVLGAKTSAAATKGAITVAVAARAEAGRLVERLRRDGYAVQQLAQAGLAAAVRELADEVVRGGSRGLLLADEAEAALIALNRRNGVRAVGGDDAAVVGRTAAAVNANTLVVRPAGKSEFVLQRIVAAWLDARASVSDEVRQLLN